MATHLKRRIAKDVTDEMDLKVRQTVEGILGEVKKRGDAAVLLLAVDRRARVGDVRVTWIVGHQP